MCLVVLFQLNNYHFKCYVAGMVARTMLAAMDHNYNTGREQAVIQTGPMAGGKRFKGVFPKAKYEWIAKPIYAKKNYTWRQELVQTTIANCEREDWLAKPIDKPNLPSNIATKPQPLKQELVTKHVTRFQSH